MNTQMVEIQPRELKFIFELKKQSSCAVHLANVTDQYVAFKVKTTSPKKYCVRPNVGIIKPQSMSDFTVTMQAQKSAPSEMLCKDKFLIQTTVVPFGTTEDDITPAMFARDGGKYMEETKLRVVLTSAPNSPEKPQIPGVWKQEASLEASILKEPILSPVNRVVKEPSYETSMPQVSGFLKQEASYEDLMSKEPHSPVLLPVNGISKLEPSYDTSKPKNNLQGEIDSPVPNMLMKEEDSIRNSRNMEGPIALKVMDNIRSVPAKEDESKWVTDTEDVKLNLNGDIEELKTKISLMDVKLVEAEDTIVKLKEEKSSVVYQMQMLKQELAMARRKSGARKVQAGFPPLFVCMVVIISLMIGFLFRSS